MRDGEVEGKTYYFVSDAQFVQMHRQGELAEAVTYNGNRYGVSKAEIERVIATGKNVFIIVENDGYHQIKDKYPDAVGIFLYVTKEDAMINMLSRGDKLEDALGRIELYDDEMKNRGEYDYVIKNVRDKRHETESIIRAIIRQYQVPSKALIKVDTNPFVVRDAPMPMIDGRNTRIGVKDAEIKINSMDFYS
jgi:guanylate kinase